MLTLLEKMASQNVVGPIGEPNKVKPSDEVGMPRRRGWVMVELAGAWMKDLPLFRNRTFRTWRTFSFDDGESRSKILLAATKGTILEVPNVYKKAGDRLSDLQ